MKTISILGSTGSVGCATVDLIKEMRDEFVVDSLTANQNWQLLAEQAKIFKPDISCILNLTPDHLDRHITMHKYATAKCNIFQNISARNVCYYEKIRI